MHPSMGAQIVCSCAASLEGATFSELCHPVAWHATIEHVELLHTHLYGIKGGGLEGSGPALNVNWGVGSALKMLRTG